MEAPILPSVFLEWSPPCASCAAVQLHREEKHGGRKRYYNILKIASILLLSSSSTFFKTDAAQAPLPKLVRKGWAKSSAAVVHDAYVSLARPLLVNLMRKAQRIGNRFLYPEYSILGRAWFNALVVDLSEYILRRSTGAGLYWEQSDTDVAAAGQGDRKHSGTLWPAASSLMENGYHGAGEAVPHLRQSKANGFNLPDTAKADGGSPPEEEDSSSSGQVLRLNKLTILKWKDAFDDIFMEVAKKVLPRHVLELVKAMDENQHSALRPTLEHALYMTLTKFYPTLMSTGTSEAILPNYHVAVSSDTCPFSLYTSYTFMALIAAGRSGVDALFLADEMMQHYKNDEPYISPECKAFNEDMTEALILDSMTLSELVGRTAGAARKSFYNLRDLVSLQKETLLGTEVKPEDADKERHQPHEQQETSRNVALREMVVALIPENRKDRENERDSLSPRFIVETFENIKAAARKLPAHAAVSASKSPHENVTREDPMVKLILERKSSILGSK